MKKQIHVCICLIAVTASAFCLSDKDLSGFMRRSSTFDRGKAMSAFVHSAIIGKDGNTSNVDFNIYTTRTDDSVGAMIAFLAPDSYKGTRILTSVPLAGGKPVVRIKLKSFFAPMRVPFSNSDASFFGMDFSAGDMNPRNASYDSYRRLGEKTGDDGATLVLVEAVPLRDKIYDRIVYYVDEDKQLIVRSEMYDGKKLEKVMDVTESRLVDGIWSAIEIRMSTLKDGTSTVMTFENLRYGEDSSAFVSEFYLRNGRIPG